MLADLHPPRLGRRDEDVRRGDRRQGLLAPAGHGVGRQLHALPVVGGHGLARLRLAGLVVQDDRPVLLAVAEHVAAAGVALLLVDQHDLALVEDQPVLGFPLHHRLDVDEHVVLHGLAVQQLLEGVVDSRPEVRGLDDLVERRLDHAVGEVFRRLLAVRRGAEGGQRHLLELPLVQPRLRDDRENVGDAGQQAQLAGVGDRRGLQPVALRLRNLVARFAVLGIPVGRRDLLLRVCENGHGGWSGRGRDCARTRPRPRFGQNGMSPSSSSAGAAAGLPGEAAGALPSSRPAKASTRSTLALTSSMTGATEPSVA